MYYPITNLIVDYANVYPPTGKFLSVHQDFKPQISLSLEYILLGGNLSPGLTYSSLLLASAEKNTWVIFWTLTGEIIPLILSRCVGNGEKYKYLSKIWRIVRGHEPSSPQT